MLTSNLVFMVADIRKIYASIFDYSRMREFSGHDPFDGLSSTVFQKSPLAKTARGRLLWLQMIKRSPVDLRKILRVQPGVNPKALALFALAETSRFRETSDERHATNARELLDRLLDMAVRGETDDGKATTAFGYNFDWQSRHFYAPRGTPAIVPTAFASQALVESYRAFGGEGYSRAVGEISQFISARLNRIETDDELCFSYTPNDATAIYNASLLAAESLARVAGLTDDAKLRELAAKAVRFVVRRQRADGAWDYGEAVNQSWVDNFHTAYVLLSLVRISSEIPSLRTEVNDALTRGIDYWINRFFLADGTPKYYDHGTYPVDIHSAAVAIAAASEMADQDQRMLPLAAKVASWTIENMYDDRGFFYYQKRANGFIKTPYMRWGQAWMAYALARLIEAEAPMADGS